jgi:hypothetical protein
MRSTALTLVALFLLGACSDVVHKNYATKAEAVADSLFEKGWLPDFVPDSAIKIQVENDLNLNISFGSFSFEPNDWAAIEKGANMQLANPAPFEGWSKTKTEFKSKGYQQLQHSEDHTTWVFFCRPSSGTCEHFMWYRKPSA